MTKNEAKKIAVERLHSILLMPSTWFEGQFEMEPPEYNEEEQDMIIEQAERLASRLIKIIVK
jgi:hypothetical protein